MPDVVKSKPFCEYMAEYKKQMEKGEIPKAYRGLMEYIMGLRTYFDSKYPEYAVSGLYQGYMDMTYFSIVPESFKERKLKFAVVFLHDTCRFEVWLAGQNKQVQAKYWNLIDDAGWNKYRLQSPGKGVDSTVEHTLVEDPDFKDINALTYKIEKETITFIRDVEAFLLKL